MPQASDKLRGVMERYFGDPIADGPPMRFLESRGYHLRRDWHWNKPTPSHLISDEEYNCLQFLIDEWDMGGIFDEKEIV